MRHKSNSANRRVIVDLFRPLKKLLMMASSYLGTDFYLTFLASVRRIGKCANLYKIYISRGF